jgi:hypothetical protein
MIIYLKSQRFWEPPSGTSLVILAPPKSDFFLLTEGFLGCPHQRISHLLLEERTFPMRHIDNLDRKALRHGLIYFAGSILSAESSDMQVRYEMLLARAKIPSLIALSNYRSNTRLDLQEIIAKG